MSVLGARCVFLVSLFVVTFQEVIHLGRINFICLVFKAGTNLVETGTGGDGSSCPTTFANLSLGGPLFLSGHQILA